MPIVTMSPFATCEISWPRTPRSSSRVIWPMMSVETATSAEFLNAPVANAFAAPGYIATSGILMFARRARSSTVATSQRSASPSVPSIVRHFIVVLTRVFDMSSEIIEPAIPKMNENIKSGPYPPSPSSAARSTPKSPQTIVATIVNVATAAILTTRNMNIRFMPTIIPKNGVALSVCAAVLLGPDRLAGDAKH